MDGTMLISEIVAALGSRDDLGTVIKLESIAKKNRKDKADG